MRQAEYVLRTYTMAAGCETKKFIGTRVEARAAAKKMDEDSFGQVTKVGFVRYWRV